MREKIYLACWWVTIVIGIVVINAIDVAGPCDVRDWVFGQTGAAWVQAIGSVGAILGAFAISQRQSRTALRAARLEAAQRRVDACHTLDFLAESCARALQHASAHLATREHVYTRAADGMPDVMLALEFLLARFHRVPVYGLPVDLLPSANVIEGSLETYLLQVKTVLATFRTMDAAAFAAFFAATGDTKRAVDNARADISSVLAHANEEVLALQN